MILDQLGAPTTIDYFSLDVEGAESIIMNSFPWRRYVFLVLTVERPKDDLQQALRDNDYVYLRTNSKFNDTTYIHRSLPGFSEMLEKYGNHPKKPLPKTCMTMSHYPTPKMLKP